MSIFIKIFRGIPTGLGGDWVYQNSTGSSAQQVWDDFDKWLDAFIDAQPAVGQASASSPAGVPTLVIVPPMHLRDP